MAIGFRPMKRWLHRCEVCGLRFKHHDKPAHKTWVDRRIREYAHASGQPVEKVREQWYAPFPNIPTPNEAYDMTYQQYMDIVEKYGVPRDVWWPSTPTD